MAKKKSSKTPSATAVDCAAPCSETDWKALALESLYWLEWSLRSLKAPPGTGLLWNRTTNKTYPWQNPIMDLIDKFPGCKIDREAVFACQLPRKERNKWFEKHRKPTSQNSNL